MSPRLRALLPSLLGCALLGCAGESAELQRRMDALRQLLLDLDAEGAMRCAPRQLAIAQSHSQFAQIERSEGYLSRAEHHLEVAERHARAARLLSPADRCGAEPTANPDA